jgi:hypothetical protein
MPLTSNNFPKVSPAPAAIVQNSPYCGLHRIGGYIERKQLAIAGSDGAQNLNLFQVTGSIEIRGLWGVFTDVTEVTTLTGASWDLYDGTNTVQITSAAGTAISGATVGSAIAKQAVAATALNFDDADQCRYSESASNKVFVGGLITQKAATNTYIRFTVTTDANTDCALNMWCIWVCREPGSLLVAV